MAVSFGRQKRKGTAVYDLTPYYSALRSSPFAVEAAFLLGKARQMAFYVFDIKGINVRQRTGATDVNA
jgi:hypothetical protein